MSSEFFLHPIKAILFDLDGTLVHSALDFNQIRTDIGCPDGQDVLSYVETLPSQEKLNAEKIIRQHELDDAHSAQVIHGASCLLERLEARGLKTAIVTRNSFEATQIKIKKCGIKVPYVLTREDAPAKPNPQGLLYFSKKWSLSPQECVYVGDYLYDLQAANNAKMHACLYLENNETKLFPEFSALADFICHDYKMFEQGLSYYLKSRG